jgi:hypothetical protein
MSSVVPNNTSSFVNYKKLILLMEGEAKLSPYFGEGKIVVEHDFRIAFFKPKKRIE